MVVQDYRYTRPRCPIAAMYASPGPTRYDIPTLVGQHCHDPRSVHEKGAAFTFGLKSRPNFGYGNPGPKYLPHAKILRDGMSYSPQFTMAPRYSDRNDYRSPGPAAYLPMTSTLTNRPPDYTFGVKHYSSGSFMTPGPNQYFLPSTIGDFVVDKSSAPAYTLLGRNFMPGSSTRIPGPGTYRIVETDVYKQKSPEFSMTANNRPPGDRTQKPGPGAHNLQLVAGRAYSFGIKHSPYSGSVMNAPLDDQRSASCLS